MECEDAVLAFTVKFLLRVVKRQRTKVVGLASRYLQFHLLDVALGSGNDTIVVIEERLWVEILWHLESLTVQLPNVEDAVEGIYHYLVVVWV